MLALQFTFSHISLETFQSLCELYRYWSSEAVKSLSRILLACSFSATGVQTTTYTDDMHPFSYLKMSHSMHPIGTVQNYRYLLRLEFCVLQLNWRTYKGWRKVWKSGVASSNVVEINCPFPSGWDRLNWFAKIWGRAPPCMPFVPPSLLTRFSVTQTETWPINKCMTFRCLALLYLLLNYLSLALFRNILPKIFAEHFTVLFRFPQFFEKIPKHT